MLSLPSFAKVIGLSLYGGYSKVPKLRKMSSEDADALQKELTEKPKINGVKSLETFMEVWPEVKKEWAGQTESQ
ncbi:hypothetical protein [Endozoicomonas sp.]|uniref:hypothetical protein n=1 Tax=Endozoicomonas sp. TaxID=1892382 RepID=UPI0028872BB7|nr:hypothetical protein [Endozoicomonas sp.]